jgi:hypothetical protein
MKTMKKLKIYFLSNNIYRGMTGIMGVNRVGLKRRPTFEEIIKH